MLHSVHRMRGLTALELLIGLGIFAVLAGLSVPTFREARRNAAVTAAVNDMVGALHFARSSAILHNVPTVMCISPDGARCATRAGDRAGGWLVFHDVKRSSPVQLDPADQLLRTGQVSTDIEVTGTRTAVTYWPVSLAGTTGTFRFCPVRGRAKGRAVIVSRTGRPRVSRGSQVCAS